MIIKNGKRLDGFCVDSLPIGTLQPYLGLKAPNGYLICDGSLISKTVYPDLYAICGSLFGAETSTHFYLPDLRGKTIAGYNAGDSTLNTIGKLLGAISHTHTSAAHTHTVAGHTHTSAAHTHSTGNHTLTTSEIPSHNHRFEMGIYNTSGGGWYNAGLLGTDGGGLQTSWGTDNAIQLTGGSGAHNHGNTGSTTPGNTGSTSLTTDSTTPGATGSSSNYQPTMVANWIVKAKILVPVTGVVEDNLNSTSTINALSAAQGKILNDKINALPKVVNNLTNTSTTNALSAAQGKALNDKISGLAKVASTGSYSDLSNKPNFYLTYDNVTGLDLGPGSTYQLTWPSQGNVAFIEPLVHGYGSEYSGGQFITPGSAYTYITNNDGDSTYRGIWVYCESGGLVRISEYRHCGCAIKGFRIWYTKRA